MAAREFGAPLAAAVILGLAGCSASDKNPSAQQAYDAVRAHLAQSGRHNSIAMGAGSPTNCREATGSQRKVLVCSVCISSVDLRSNVSGSILEAKAVKAVYDVTFSRAISYDQPDLQREGSDAVWVVSPSARRPITGPLTTRLDERLDESTFRSAGIVFEVVPVLQWSSWRAFDGSGNRLDRQELRSALSGAEARRAFEARYNACDKSIEDKPGDDGPAPAAEVPRDAEWDRPEEVRLATRIGEDTGSPGNDWLEVMFEKSYALCAYLGKGLYDPTIDGSRPLATGADPIDPVKNKVAITGKGQIHWNGSPIDMVRLRQYLDLTTSMNPQPFLVVEPEAGAGPLLVHEVREVVVRSGVCPELPKCGTAAGRSEGTCYP